MKYTDEQKQAMAAKYAAGTRLKDLADEYHVSIPTMSKYVRAGGGTVRKPGKVSTKTVSEAYVVEAVAEPVVESARTILPFE